MTAAAKTESATPSPWINYHGGISKSYEANARLIAAAPELYEHVKQFARVAEYQARVARSRGDEEGARLATVTLNMILATISKIEG